MAKQWAGPPTAGRWQLKPLRRKLTAEAESGAELQKLYALSLGYASVSPLVWMLPFLWSCRFCGVAVAVGVGVGEAERTRTLRAIEDFHRIYRRATGVVTAGQPDAVSSVGIGRKIAASGDERLAC